MEIPGSERESVDPVAPAAPLVGRHFMVPAVVVTIAAGAVGAFFGVIALFPYTFTYHARPVEPTAEELRIESRLRIAGPVLGGVSGILAGVAWSRLLVRRACRPGGPLNRRGAILGAVAGASSTAVLHLGLSLIQEGLAGLVFQFPAILLGGLIFGIPAGAWVGSLGGTALEFARRRILVRPALAAANVGRETMP